MISNMGMDVSIDFETGDAPKDIRRDFRNLGDAIEDRESEAIEDTAEAIEDLAAALAPVDTGRLQSSIDSAVELAGTTYKAFVGSNVEYAPYVEFGTRPHKIGGGLRFKWPDAPPSEVAYFQSIGSWPYVMYDEVQHPGTEGQFFLTSAVETHRSTFRANIIMAARRAERDAGGG